MHEVRDAMRWRQIAACAFAGMVSATVMHLALRSERPVIVTSPLIYSQHIGLSMGSSLRSAPPGAASPKPSDALLSAAPLTTRYVLPGGRRSWSGAELMAMERTVERCATRDALDAAYVGHLVREGVVPMTTHVRP